MVLLVESSSGETFTVWAAASAAVPTCDAEVAQRTAGLAGTRATVTSYLDASLATGTKVSNPPMEDTVVCTQKDGMRYVVHDFSILSTSSFSIIAASWRWS